MYLTKDEVLKKKKILKGPFLGILCTVVHDLLLHKKDTFISLHCTDFFGCRKGLVYKFLMKG